MTSTRQSLDALAEACGVQPSYADVFGRQWHASDEALLRVLRCLEAPVASAEDASAALREVRQRQWRRVIEPVTVQLAGRPAHLPVRLAGEHRRGAFRLSILLENGGEVLVEGRRETLEAQEELTLEGAPHVRLSIGLPAGTPIGYHHLVLELDGDGHDGWLLVAPERLWSPDGLRAWGVFAPTYALHGESGWGAGRLTDLERFADFVESLGGGVVGTLPLLAAFLDEPFEPSPYAPVSRLAWNELFLDLERVPEWQRCARARDLAAASTWTRAIGEMRASDRVDYKRLWAHMRPVIDRLASCAAEDPATASQLDAWACCEPHADRYARFRGVMAAEGRPWGGWPERLRDGDLAGERGDPVTHRRHLYAQWRLSQQLDSVCARARRNGPGLYLDMPLGVHPDGYDAWSERESFAQAMATGAPPDDFFTLGQNWGFAPPHPRHIRERGYRYLSACLGSQLRRAGMLRIDHVMGLHRLFWIPDGMSASDGVYVRYRPEEMYAVLAIESHRHRSVIVGEDLGTVPDEVRETMSRRGVLRMYVLQFEVGPDRFGQVPSGCVASLNTHDMPPFAAWWHGRDVDARVELGYLDASEVGSEHGRRAATRDNLRRHVGAGETGAEPGADAEPVLAATLERLAEGPARVELVNLEDLWLEERAQNMPGTGADGRNWCGKARLSVESLQGAAEVITQLGRIDERRRA